MINHLKRVLRPTLTVLSASILFLSCEKDDRTSAEWGELASAKRIEILALSSSISCSQKDNVTIQKIKNGCSIQYFAVHAADLGTYEKLKKEYLQFLDGQYASWHREGLIVDPCHESIWATEQPIRLDCKAGHVMLITSENISLEEAAPLADASHQEIMNFVNGQTCGDQNAFSYTGLINYKLMKIEFIPYSKQTDYQNLKDKVSLYNRLAFRIVQEAGTGNNFQPQKQVESIECVDGRPVIKFRN